jgi:tetratricopeptide (TPR) repeat protein
MSRSDKQPSPRAGRSLQDLEQFWGAPLPAAFAHLYTQFATPFLAPCEFFALEAMAEGHGREFGMLPSFLPFCRAIDEGGIYGFYRTRDNLDGGWPVLYWETEEMYLKPVASDFEAFLRRCVLVGRYETEIQGEDAEGGGDENARRIVRGMNLPPALLTAALPRNDSELHERLVALDPQDAQSLCHLGCTQRSRGDDERALDFFHRASEAAPWFGDAYYLVADVYRERNNFARAVPEWWAVAKCLLPLCTRTWEWDLGADHPVADIYEVAADALSQFEKEATPEIKADRLWANLVHEDPYDPDVRERLGQTLLKQGELHGAERELLNALSLCSSERGKQPERLYDALLSLYTQQNRPHDVALARHDRSLPRS